MLLRSDTHTIGDVIRWRVNYKRWLDNSASISVGAVSSSSATLTVSNVSVHGFEIIFFVSGGALNETATLTLTMTDSFGNVKHDTINLTVVAA